MADYTNAGTVNSNTYLGRKFANDEAAQGVLVTSANDVTIGSTGTNKTIYIGTNNSGQGQKIGRAHV